MASQSGRSKLLIISSAALVVGNLVGAGILGLPINTGLAGLWPSLVAMVVGGLVMSLTAVILGGQAAACRSETFDYPSLYEKYLGKIGKWVAIAANLVILYGLLTAYFTGGATIAASLVGRSDSGHLILFLFAAPLILITCMNVSLLQKLNIFFILLLVSTFGLILFFGFRGVHTERMHYTDWSFLPSTLPIIITAFHFHNIIPVLSAHLEWDRAKFNKSVALGMTLAFAMNGLWVMVAIGVLPLSGENSILNAWETNLPATVPMANQLKNSTFTLFASLFAMVAICTSFLANGLGLQNFIRDLLGNTFKIKSRALVIIATFLPPLLTAFFYPDIFLKALDIVGGVGIVVLFCLLPTLIVIMDNRKSKTFRALCTAAFLFALFILVMEILQECGMLQLHPWIEYHKIDFSAAL